LDNLAARVYDLEAYVNNGATAADADATGKTTSNLTGPGPGHNAWMLTSTALVLMMTLPDWPCSTVAWFVARTSSPSVPSVSASPVW
jgi:hypothetical protein